MSNTDFASIAPVLERNGVEYAGVFGSRARGDEGADSDMDILIRPREPIGLFGLAGLQQELSEKLGRRVDLVTEGGLSPYIRERILQDLRVFYGKR